MGKKITVDKNKCVHCGLCIKDCLIPCLEFDEEKIPKYKQNGEQNCIACQHCMAICPVGALSFGDRNPENSTKVSYGDSEELLNLIKSRRSLRDYKKEDVPFEKLEKIKNMLPYCPTGGNVDCLHFSIVQTKEKMDEIIKTTYEKIIESDDNSPFFETARNSYLNGNDIIYRGATSLISASIDKTAAIPGCETTDPIIALSFADLYATSLGLGTLWCDMALLAAEKIPEVYSLLQIPKNYTLSYILLLGTPNVKYQRTIQPEPFNVNFVK